MSALMRSLVPVAVGALWMLQSVKEDLSCSLCAEKAGSPVEKLCLNML